jgi:hypothetical protein
MLTCKLSEDCLRLQVLFHSFAVASHGHPPVLPDELFTKRATLALCIGHPAAWPGPPRLRSRLDSLGCK